MPDNFNTIEGTEVLNLNDATQGSHAVTLDDVKEYSNTGVPGELVFEAYLKQTGVDSIHTMDSGSLVIGTTYVIDYYAPGDDFTNVGALVNESGVRFIATGTTPTVWTEMSSLSYNDGAPTCTYIIKNTIGCKGFSYKGAGIYQTYFPPIITTPSNIFVQTGNILGAGAIDFSISFGQNTAESIYIYIQIKMRLLKITCYNPI